MTPVELRYADKVYRRAIPDNWNELRRADLLEICRYFDGRTLLREAAYKFTLHLMGFKFGHLAVNKAILKVPHEQIHEVSKLVDWIFKPSTLTKNLLPTLKVGRHTYVGPADGLNRATFDEVVTAYVKQNLYKQHADAAQKQRYLAELVATLYRPRKWWWWLVRFFPDLSDGDARIAFNEATVKARAKRLAKLPTAELYAVLLYFEGCHSLFERIAPHVFSTKGVGEGKKSRFGWETFYVGMAGDKFGTIDKVGRTYFTNILIGLEDKLSQKPAKPAV